MTLADDELSDADGWITSHFPGLTPGSYLLTSRKDAKYNCIAHAAGDSSKDWWPNPPFYWPPGVLRAESLRAFKDAFSSLGYFAECASEALEEGVEKVALFAKEKRPTHAARQLECGLWTSKLGEGYDLSHPLRAVEGRLYGQVALIVGRRRK